MWGQRGLRLWVVLSGLILCTASGSRPALGSEESAAEQAPWQVGLARAIVTPQQTMWMAGYASRDRPAEGKAQDLWAKAAVIESADGGRLVVITLDLIGVPRTLRESVLAALQTAHGIADHELWINASHTHCGPEFRRQVNADEMVDAARQAQAVEYQQFLVTTLIDLVKSAWECREPARLGWTHARCGFAMNRRLPSSTGYQNSPFPDGPVDHAVPVLRIDRLDGTLRGVVFGYACHNTTLAFFQWCGDYAGFAQSELEAAHPDVTAMFVTGCGGDQNPYPRGQLELAQQHGRALANAVEAALLVKPMPITGKVEARLEHVPLPFATLPTAEELRSRLSSSNRYEVQHARRLLSRLENDGGLPTEYPCPVQVLRLGEVLTIVTLGGEVVVDYSLRLKAELNEPRLWVAGYSNDVFGYVPSRRVLLEGGYEAGGAMLYTSHPGPFSADVEERLVSAVKRLTDETRAAVKTASPTP
jgi:neutral ceramidase